MKIIHLLLDKIIFPLLTTLLAPMIVSIISKLNTGDWVRGFSNIPSLAWVIFALFITFWVIVIAIRTRIKKLQNLDIPISVIGFVPRYGWVTVGKLRYAGVVWKINAPAPAPWESLHTSIISPSRIEVETPPRCPVCETELEQSHSFWGGYVWKCVGAGCCFKKRNWDSYYREAERVKKNASRELEKQQNLP